MDRPLPSDPAGYQVRFKRVVSHMICESLGYFTPRVAANALRHYKVGEPFACEWYSHMCNCRGKGYFDQEELLKVGRDVLVNSIKNRSHHHGFMAEYELALSLVEHENATGDGPLLASWF